MIKYLILSFLASKIPITWSVMVQQCLAVIAVTLSILRLFVFQMWTVGNGQDASTRSMLPCVCC